MICNHVSYTLYPFKLNLTMGIIRLGDFIKKTFPQVIKPRPPLAYRKGFYAVDASNTIYSFLAKTITFSKNKVNMPTDSFGNMTGHLIGLLYRALLCKELGIQTVWVFDGKPPRQKSQQLYRRRTIKEEAAEKASVALDLGDFQEAVKQSKRTIFINATERQDAKKLISLMGLPVIQAQSQAEAQCAWLSKNKLVDGVISEDIDTLVFGAEKIIKKFSRDEIANEINLSELLSALGLTYQQFIDFCILCGCDYTAKIAGIGPVKALKMIKEKQNIERTIQYIMQDNKLRSKHPIPDDFNYLIARRLFTHPHTTSISETDLQRKHFQQDQLREFLLQRQFNENRIKNWIEKAKDFDRLNII